MIGPCDPVQPLARLIEKLEKGIEFALSGGQTISDVIMVSKGITILSQMYMFNKDIRECRRQTTYLNTWANYNTFFHKAHRDQSREVTTAGKGGYIATVHNIYGVPPPPTEENHKAIHNLNPKEFRHRVMIWKDRHKPMQSLPDPNQQA